MKITESWTAQMVLAGALTFAGCLAIGYFAGSPSSKPKKTRQGGGGMGMDMGGEDNSRDLKLERLFKTAELLMKQENIAQAEVKYLEALEIVQDMVDPQLGPFLDGLISTKLFTVLEKQGKYEEAEKYISRAIENYESRDLQPQEYDGYGELLEHAIDLCISKLTSPEKAVKYLHMWHKLGERMGNDDIISVSCSLLGNIKANLGQYEEAEMYCKKVITLTAKKGGEITISTMLKLTNIFYHLEKHEENKKLIADIIGFISTLEHNNAASLSSRLGEAVFDFGYWPEALSLFQRTLDYSNRSLASFDDIADIENCIAETIAESGKVAEARERLRKLAEILGADTYGDGLRSPPLTVSQYFETKDAVVESTEDGKVVHSIKLKQRTLTNRKKKLPAGAVLVCSVENPESGRPHIEAQLPASATVEIDIELPFAKKGYYIAQIDVYSNDSKTNKISTHVVLSNCDTDINVPVASEPVAAEPEPVSVSALPADVIQTAVFAPSSPPSSSPSITPEPVPSAEESKEEPQVAHESQVESESRVESHEVESHDVESHEEVPAEPHEEVPAEPHEESHEESREESREESHAEPQVLETSQTEF